VRATVDSKVFYTDTALVRGFGEQAVEVLKQRAGGEILKPEVVAEGTRREAR